MPHHLVNKPWVLAIDPWRLGFGFVFFEGPDSLIDWGVRQVPADDRNRHCLERLGQLIERYGPQVVVLEDWSDSRCLRCDRVRHLLAAAADQAAQAGCLAVRLSGRAVAEGLTAALALRERPPNKDETARLLAIHYPELSPRLPPRRKPWMSEDSRMALFDACALACAYYQRRADQRSPAKINNP